MPRPTRASLNEQIQHLVAKNRELTAQLEQLRAFTDDAAPKLLTAAKFESLVQEVLGIERGPMRVTIDGRTAFESDGPWLRLRQSWISRAEALLK